MSRIVLPDGTPAQPVTLEDGTNVLTIDAFHGGKRINRRYEIHTPPIDQPENPEDTTARAVDVVFDVENSLVPKGAVVTRSRVWLEPKDDEPEEATLERARAIAAPAAQRAMAWLLAQLNLASKAQHGNRAERRRAAKQRGKA